MRTKNRSKLEMYLTVRIFLLANPEITDTLPNFPEFLAALDAAILQIHTSTEENHFDTTGVKDNKEQYKDTLVNLTLEESGKLRAFANNTHDTVLLAETRFTKTDLTHIPGLELVDISRGLQNRINAHIDVLAPYRLTVASQVIYKTAIDTFETLITSTRQTQMKSREYTLLELQGYTDADAAIDNIDKVVEIVRFSEPVFYAGYKNARKIVELGTNSLQAKGYITDAATGKPIAGAIVSFRLQGHTEVAIEKETALKGGCNIKTLAEGVYDVTVTKVGFQPKTVTVVINWYELCRVEVALEKM
jgi:hypothetical protein